MLGPELQQKIGIDSDGFFDGGHRVESPAYLGAIANISGEEDKEVISVIRRSAWEGSRRLEQ